MQVHPLSRLVCHDVKYQKRSSPLDLHLTGPVLSSTRVLAVSFRLTSQPLSACLGKIGPDRTPHLCITSQSPYALHLLQTLFLFSASWPSATSLAWHRTIWLPVTVRPLALTQTGCHCGNWKGGGVGRQRGLVVVFFKNNEREADVKLRKMSMTNLSDKCWEDFQSEMK